MVWFLGTIVTLMPETALVSLRALAFFFPLVTGTFSSFNTFRLSITAPVSILPCLCQSFAIEVSDLYSSSPLSLIFVIGHRCLLMNLHVVQFEYSFDSRGLTFSQFVQTFQDIIGGDL